MERYLQAPIQSISKKNGVMTNGSGAFHITSEYSQHFPPVHFDRIKLTTFTRKNEGCEVVATILIIIFTIRVIITHTAI